MLQGGEGDQAVVGRAAAESNTLIVPVPSPPLLAPIVELPGSKLVVSR